MNKKLLVAALVAPSLALSFNPAWAHGCAKHHRHYSKTSSYSQSTYGSGKTTKSKKPSSQSPSSSPDQGSPNAGSSSSGGGNMR